MVVVLVSCVVLAATGAMRGRAGESDLAMLGMVAPGDAMGRLRASERPR